MVRSFSGITIRKTTPCKVESVDIDRRLKFRIADVKRPSRIEFYQYRRARDLLKGNFIYIYIFFFFVVKSTTALREKVHAFSARY